MPESATVPATVPKINKQNPIPDIANWILSNKQFARDEGDALYVYQNGVYVPHGERLIEMWTQTMLAKGKVAWNPSRGRDTAKYILLKSKTLWDRPPIDRINLKNGILDWQTKELLPHTPDFLSHTQLPVIYDPHARSSAWRHYNSTAFPKDSQELPWEIAAWLMVPIMEIQRAVLLLGGRGTGKSTFLRALRAFLGEDNCCKTSLHMLEKSRFHTTSLMGKLACICPDLPSEKLTGTDIFKALTGGDPIPAEYKNGKIFSILPYSRMVFSANNPPESDDKSGADIERWLPVRMSNKFTNNPQKTKDLDIAMSRPEELSGVLNEALRVLPSVLANGITLSASLEAGLEHLRSTSNPATLWITENLVADDDESKRILCSQLYKVMQEHENIEISYKSFGELLNQIFPRSWVTRHRHGGGDPKYYRHGVKWAQEQSIQ